MSSMQRANKECSGSTLVSINKLKAPATVVAVNVPLLTQGKIDFRMTIKLTAITTDVCTWFDFYYLGGFHCAAFS